MLGFIMGGPVMYLLTPISRLPKKTIQTPRNTTYWENSNMVGSAVRLRTGCKDLNIQMK
jgi:hypothetical protein